MTSLSLLALSKEPRLNQIRRLDKLGNWAILEIFGCSTGNDEEDAGNNS